MGTMISEKDAAAYLGISESRLRTLVDRKQVPAYSVGGTYLRFKTTELEGIKGLLTHAADPGTERIFHQEFKKTGRFERFIEFVRANDLYLVGIAIIAAVLYFVFLRT